MNDRNSYLIDEVLVMDAQDGDRHSMDELVQRWQKRLWLHAYRLTADPQAAWDVTQQTWLAIIKGLSKLHDPAKFKPWAYRIATNKAIDLLKAKQATQPLSEQPTQDMQTNAGADCTFFELLDHLNANQKAVIALYYMDDLTIAEISSVLDIPEGTVKSRLHNARNELKKRWQHYLD